MLNKRETLARVGSMEQLAYARRMEMVEGSGKGLSVVEVKCGDIDYTVILDRGMDIANVNYHGQPMSYISKTGLTSPFSYEEEGLGFLRSFSAGLLTTCGLTYNGAPCTDGDEVLGLHGRANSLLGSDIGIRCEFEEDQYVVRIKGKLRESKVFGENVVLRREIISRLGENTIEVCDSVENEGFETAPYMLLYHCNFGYPLLDAHTRLEIESSETVPRDEVAELGITSYKEFQHPTKAYKEQVFYHKPVADDQGWSRAKLINNQLGIKMTMAYSAKHLPYLIQWKQMGEGDYVLGLEPASWLTYGRAEAKKRNELDFIQPGEIRSTQLLFSFEKCGSDD